MKFPSTPGFDPAKIINVLDLSRDVIRASLAELQVAGEAQTELPGIVCEVSEYRILKNVRIRG